METEAANPQVKKGQIRQWALGGEHKANGLTFKIILMPDEETPLDVAKWIGRSTRDVCGQYLKRGQHPAVVNESNTLYTTAPESYVQNHSVVIEEVVIKKPRPRTAGKAFEKFEIKVSLDPKRDVPAASSNALADKGVLACECPVSNALHHALKPRFRRWNNVRVFTRVMNVELKFKDAKGKDRHYVAPLGGGLSRARHQFDRAQPVEPAEGILSFSVPTDV